MSSNFLYGRAALESSALRNNLPINDSIRPPQPVGFYYEDDSPYEQNNNTQSNNRAQEVKSIYLGADTLNAGSTDGTDASDDLRQNQPLVEFNHSREATIDRTQQNKDIEQRLKHSQQHMYQSRDSGEQ